MGWRHWLPMLFLCTASCTGKTNSGDDAESLSRQNTDPAAQPPPSVFDSTAAQFDEYMAGSTISVMSSEGIGEPTLLRLLAHPEMRAITEIAIREQQLGVLAINAIMTAGSTEKLHSLYLAGNPLGDAGIKALAGSPRLAQIENLHLPNTGAGSEGIAALAASPHLRAKNLFLGWQPIGDEGAIALVGAKQVKHLRLESAEVGGEGAVALIERGQFTSLSLITNPVQLDGLSQISASIESLRLIECPLRLADIQRLAAARAPGLKALSLKWSPIEDEGLRALMNAPWFSQLESLDITANKASPAARRAFIEAYGEGRFLSIFRVDL
jgi:hypothetical protein